MVRRFVESIPHNGIDITIEPPVTQHGWKGSPNLGASAAMYTNRITASNEA